MIKGQTNSGSFKKGSSGFNRKHTEESKRKISESKKGKKHPLSEETKQKMRHPHKTFHPRRLKDRTLLKKSENKMNDTQYKYWVKEVRTRDINICRLLSNECKGRLETHHIFSWREYPELRYVINNGITLCVAHHPRKRAEEKRMIPIFQELLSVSKD